MALMPPRCCQLSCPDRMRLIIIKAALLNLAFVALANQDAKFRVLKCLI